MPILTIFTNVEKTSIPKDFVEETAKSVAQAAGKTKQSDRPRTNIRNFYFT